MRKYEHLKEGQREKLCEMRLRGEPMASCASALGVHKSTVSRELGRNTAAVGRGVYLPDRAENLYRGRRRACRPRVKMDDPVFRRKIMVMIQRGWSPELIAGRLKREYGRTVISHETLYDFIYDSEIGRRDGLYEYLPRGKKRRSKRRGRRSQKSRLEGRIFIEARPNEANERSELGHWETDTMLCKWRDGVNVLVDRMSRKVIITKLVRKDAAATTSAVTERLSCERVKSITADNGPENAEHEKIAATLKALFFFCRPYHSWEKGTVENRNGVIRRYLPRSTDLSMWTQQELDEVAEDINTTPMRYLDYQTPNEFLSARCTWS
jgi:transposase, IS30 family